MAILFIYQHLLFPGLFYFFSPLLKINSVLERFLFPILITVKQGELASKELVHCGRAKHGKLLLCQFA